MRDFAQELIDEILDCLVAITVPQTPQFYPRGLGAFGLVCKQWLPRIRSHLFSSVILRPTTVQGFFDLLDTSSSAILSDVQALELVLTGPQLLTETQMQRFRQSPKLTVLRIDMQDVEMEELIMHSLCASLQWHVSVLGATVLSVSTFCIQFNTLAPLSIGAIASAVSAFPSLEILQLRGHEITAAEVVSESSSSSLARLHTVDLGISYHGADHFFSFIQSLPVLPVLKTLDVNIRETHLGGAFEFYIRNEGRDIQRLKITAVTLGPLGPGPTAVLLSALQHTPNLQDLRIIGDSPILDILSVTSSRKLNRIRIYQGISRADLIQNPWSEIDTALANSRLRALRSFQVYSHTIQITATGFVEDHLVDLTGTSKVRAAMPLASARGILGT
ncbi:hypothetical protein FB451DRAFT_1558297 [Mycena latifolia]|nr:hypothetical protein FB451DRAFT_1558297 [Mycena latifolia]